MRRILSNTVKLVCIILFTYSCQATADTKEENKSVVKKSYTKKEAVKVSVAKVEKTAFYQELISNGKLVAKQKALVPFRLQEQIAEVHVVNGSRVKKGDLLARLESFTYKKQP